MIWLLSMAWAAGVDADLELLHLTVGHDSMLGIRSPTLTDFGGTSIVLLNQYQQDPLVLYEEGFDQGAVIAKRLTSELGIGFDFSKRLGLRISLPTTFQWGTEIPNLTRSGLGVGDGILGTRILLSERGNRSWGLSTDAILPSSTNAAWLGEQEPRLSIASIHHVSRKDMDFFINGGLLLRQPVNTNLDFILGNEIQMRFGARWNIWPEHFAFGTSIISHMGTVNFLNGGAENSSEILNSVQWQSRDNLNATIGIGKGISTGYGTSEIRLVANLRFTRKPAPPPPPEDFIVDIEEPVVPVLVEETPDWEPEELAKVEADQIIIRDNIQFELGTANILPESKPTLIAIAKLVNTDVQLGHIVIEGHASEEGTDAFNYDLSNLRARSIYRALVEVGVHPDRLSHRGYGEALPKVTIQEGEDDSLLAENRRVEFHIVRQDPPETKLELRTIIKQPWNGRPLRSIIPKPSRKNTTDDIDTVFEFKSDNQDKKEEDSELGQIKSKSINDSVESQPQTEMPEQATSTDPNTPNGPLKAQDEPSKDEDESQQTEEVSP